MDYPVRDGAGGIVIPGEASGPRTPATVFNNGVFSAINTDLLSGVVSGWVDVSDCLEMCVQIIGSAGISAGAIIFEQTNDPLFTAVNPPVTEFNVAGGTQLVGAQAVAANASRIFLVPIACRYLRVRISTAFVGGTVRAFALGRNFDVEVRGGAGGGAIVGQSAHLSAVSGNPVRIGGRMANTLGFAATSGQAVDLITQANGYLIVRPDSIPDFEWAYAAVAGGIINTADVAVKAAAGAGIRNFMKSFQVQNTNAVATEFVIKDGATVIWRGLLPANMAYARDVPLVTPLRSSANAAFNVACITTGAAVYFNAQGYAAN